MFGPNDAPAIFRSDFVANSNDSPWLSHPDAPLLAYSPVYGEYASGDYERTFVLSDEIDAEKIEARLKDGVLRLTLPKAAAAQAKRIQLRSS